MAKTQPPSFPCVATLVWQGNGATWINSHHTTNIQSSSFLFPTTTIIPPNSLNQFAPYSSRCSPHFPHFLHLPSPPLIQQLKLQQLSSLQDQIPTSLHTTKVGISHFSLFSLIWGCLGFFFLSLFWCCVGWRWWIKVGFVTP